MWPRPMGVGVVANHPSQARVVSNHLRSQIDLEKTITLLGKHTANKFVQLNVSLLHCFCVLFNSFAKLYTHFWPFTSTSGGKIILQTLVVVITATSVCKMILPQMDFYEPRVKANYF